MKNLLIYLILISSFIFINDVYSGIKNEKVFLKYCVPGIKINFNPFRQITQGKELAIFSPLMKSMISKSNSSEGIIDKFHFDPINSIFTGHVSDYARFNDGTPVTVYDVVFSIVEGFKYRPLGHQLTLKDEKGYKHKKWYESKSIRFLNSNKFSIQFKKSSKNIQKLLLNALESGSMVNRIWPVKLKKLNFDLPNRVTYNDVPFRYKVFKENNITYFNVGNSYIRITNETPCRDPDLTYYPDYDRVSTDQYEFRHGYTHPAMVFMLINPKKISSIDKRKAIGSWFRWAFSSLSPPYGFTSSKAFFLETEPGWVNNLEWSTLKTNIPSELKIVIDVPTSRFIIKSFNNRYGKNFKIINRDNLKDNDFDVEILMTRIDRGHVPFLNHILRWNNLSKLISYDKNLHSILKKFESNAATINPLERKYLYRFQKIASESFVLVPLGRRKGYAFSRRNSPVVLTIDKFGDLSFVLRSIVKESL